MSHGLSFKRAKYVRSRRTWPPFTPLLAKYSVRSPMPSVAVCELLLGDHDDMIVKAMSWALRTLAKRDPKRAAAFIQQHRGQLHPRVVREVGNKLRTGLKNPRSR